ncbi:hypothetical protein V8E36_009684 [Tilletia maclaganii]
MDQPMQMEFGPDGFDKRGQLLLRDMPAPEDQVPAIKVGILLTFPTSDDHLAAHHRAEGTNFTMALLGAVVREYGWASNVMITDAQTHAMAPEALVPWTAQSAFEDGFGVLMAANPNVRFGVMQQEELRSPDILDLTSTLGAPSIALQLGGKQRIVVFGPHPSAAYMHDQVAGAADFEIRAFEQLQRSFNAVDIILTGRSAQRNAMVADLPSHSCLREQRGGPIKTTSGKNGGKREGIGDLTVPIKRTRL